MLLFPIEWPISCLLISSYSQAQVELGDPPPCFYSQAHLGKIRHHVRYKSPCDCFLPLRLTSMFIGVCLQLHITLYTQSQLPSSFSTHITNFQILFSPLLSPFFSYLLSSATSFPVTFPFDITKTRLQIQGQLGKGRTPYRGMFKTVLGIGT